MDCRRLRRAAAVIGSTATLLAPLAAGQAANAAEPLGSTGNQIVVTTSPAAPAPAGSAEAAASCGRYYRTWLCWQTRVTVTVLRNRVPVGYLYGTLTQSLSLNIKSRGFTEKVALKTDRIVGNASGIRESLSVSCGSGCTARPSGLSGKSLLLGRTVNGKVGYSDSVKRGKAHAARTRYTMTFVKVGFTPAVAGWQSPIDFRCDDKLNGQRPGCVFPSFAPAITTLRGLRFIAPNIRRWQAKGAPKVLHRNSYLTRTHRRDVCGKAKLPAGWTAPAGWPKPVTDKPNKPSCDEYAFAASWEGGSKRGNGYGWVPKRENDQQGNRLKTFYYANRVLDATSSTTKGDAFRVAV